MAEFILDPKLEADTLPLADIGLCRVRLMNDARFPWLILVPMRGGVREIHELTPLDQTMLTFETTQMSKLLQTATGATKMNIAALGNQVPQLHVHVIGRTKDDAAWPNPVWASGTPNPYTKSEADAFVQALTKDL
ncbi:MAG: HIT family protein [Pseudomonadota bacterium]